MKAKLLLTALTTLVSMGTANAGWPNVGSWEFVETLDVVGDPALDKAVVFSFYNATESRKQIVKREIHELQTLAGFEYRKMNNLLTELYQSNKAQWLHDLTYFQNRSLRNFKEEQYLTAKSHDGVMFFSHQLNQPVTGVVYAMYPSLNDFATITLDSDWFSCNSSSGYCRDVTVERLSPMSVNKLKSAFKSAYGINVAGSSFLLFDYRTKDMYAVQYSRGGLARAVMYYLNLGTMATKKPISITQFRF